MGNSAQIWTAIVISSIAVSTGSYGWSAVTLSGVAGIGLISILTIAISQWIAREQKYIEIIDEEIKLQQN